MITRAGRYEVYERSRLPWVSELPAGWKLRRLRNLVDVAVSNVDKTSVDGEQPVRLCNYVDVFRNDRISSEMSFMQATATDAEIERFRLHKSDVVITKDSEDWKEIGVPAYVASEADDLLCGYHLAILRPRGVRGDYLFRCLQAPIVNAQWSVKATGVTRHGLSVVAIKDLLLPLPPREDQIAVARSLDYLDVAIGAYVRRKRDLLGLLRERKAAIVDEIVTSRFRNGVDRKPSGVKWLGDIPVQWDVRPMKRHFREVDERSESGTEELLSVSHITGVTPRSEKNVTMFMAASYVGHKRCRPNDLVINTMWAWMGALGVAATAGIVSPSYGVYRLERESPLSPEYAELLLRSRGYVAEYMRRSTGIRGSRLRLYPDEFLRIPMVCPPPEEQRQIVQRIRSEATEVDRLSDLVRSELNRIKEYRTRVIQDLATGQLDVREFAGSLPTEVVDPEFADPIALMSEDLEGDPLGNEVLEEVAL